MNVQCRSDVIHSRMDDQGVLLDLRTKVYFTLDAMGNAIYERLKVGQCRDEVISELASFYPEEPRSELARGVDDLIAALVEEELLEEVEGQGRRTEA